MNAEKLKLSHNLKLDIVTIEGINYSGDLFRQLGGLLPLNVPFKLVERQPDGVLVLHQLEQLCDAQSAGGK